MNFLFDQKWPVGTPATAYRRRSCPTNGLYAERKFYF